MSRSRRIRHPAAQRANVVRRVRQDRELLNFSGQIALRAAWLAEPLFAGYHGGNDSLPAAQMPAISDKEPT